MGVIGLKSRHWQKGSPGSSRGGTVFSPFPGSRVCSHSLAHSFHVSLTPLASAIRPPSLAPSLQPPSYEDPCDYTGPTRMLWDHLPISRFSITPAKSLLPQRAPGFRRCPFGGHSSGYHRLLEVSRRKLKQSEGRENGVGRRRPSGVVTSVPKHEETQV